MKKIFFTVYLFASQFILQAQTHKIGENFGGGIVFSITADSLHGLITETIDQSKKACDWNEALIAIQEVQNHSEEGKIFNDWRLPTIDELNLIYLNLRIKNLCSTLISVCFQGDYYWSSSDYIYTDPETGDKGYNFAWYLQFSDGKRDWTAMGNANSVRAVRGF
ncbi:MAG: DUF1566 domain-containing protein [Bacteroidota bacterium]